MRQIRPNPPFWSSGIRPITSNIIIIIIATSRTRTLPDSLITFTPSMAYTPRLLRSTTRPSRAARPTAVRWVTPPTPAPSTLTPPLPTCLTRTTAVTAAALWAQADWSRQVCGTVQIIRIKKWSVFTVRREVLHVYSSY